MGDGPHNTIVIPAKAGIHSATVKSQWIPAFAGMTDVGDFVGIADVGNEPHNTIVIPAKAGIHFATVKKPMDSGFRGNNGCG